MGMLIHMCMYVYTYALNTMIYLSCGYHSLSKIQTLEQWLEETPKCVNSKFVWMIK